MNTSELTVSVHADIVGGKDVTFHRWAAEGLVWLPEKGMGYLRVPTDETVYDSAYFEKYEGYAATPMGKAITAARVALVGRYTRGEVIDVGIGCGDFVSERGGLTWGYDVNPAGIAWLHSVDRWRDPYEGAEAVSLWDVIEHLAEPAKLLACVRRFVFCSLPIVPGNHGPPPPHWRHTRPTEHAWYWNRAGFIAWMAEQGFGVLEASDVETQLGRSDIRTFALERVA